MENFNSPRQSLLMFLLFIFMFIVSLRGEEVVDGSSIAQAPTTANNTYNITHDVIDEKDGRGGGGGSGGGGRGWGGGGGGGGGSDDSGQGGGGGGGGGGSREGGGGSGGGMGGGGGWWAWGCRKQKKHNNVRGHRQWHMNNNQDYKIGEFAQCMVKGRCKGMRLDCPLHCGGPCFYDCIHMCKAHCRRRR
uniref:RNA-binding protein cabeza n=1 Tax=Nicotiana sylvestris TaxID=4096 RepID=A0A1U7YLJ6_NICSY|nr:PREDICTED: RNA-binding protein cabeza [Nicotiana sylvestris]